MLKTLQNKSAIFVFSSLLTWWGLLFTTPPDCQNILTGHFFMAAGDLRIEIMRDKIHHVETIKDFIIQSDIVSLSECSFMLLHPKIIKGPTEILLSQTDTLWIEVIEVCPDAQIERITESRTGKISDSTVFRAN